MATTCMLILDFTHGHCASIEQFAIHTSVIAINHYADVTIAIDTSFITSSLVTPTELFLPPGFAVRFEAIPTILFMPLPTYI